MLCGPALKADPGSEVSTPFPELTLNPAKLTSLCHPHNSRLPSRLNIEEKAVALPVEYGLPAAWTAVRGSNSETLNRKDDVTDNQR